MKLTGGVVRGGGKDKAVVGKRKGKRRGEAPRGFGKGVDVVRGEPEEQTAGWDEGAGAEGEEGGGTGEGAGGDGMEQRRRVYRIKYHVRIAAPGMCFGHAQGSDRVGRGSRGLRDWKRVVFEAAAEDFDVSQFQITNEFVEEGAFFLIWLDECDVHRRRD